MSNDQTELVNSSQPQLHLLLNAPNPIGDGSGIAGTKLVRDKKTLHMAAVSAKIRHQKIERYFVRNLEKFPQWDEIIDRFITELINYGKQGVVSLKKEQHKAMQSGTPVSEVPEKKEDETEVKQSIEQPPITNEASTSSKSNPPHSYPRHHKSHKYWYDSYEWNEELEQQVSRISGLTTEGVIGVLKTSTQTSAETQDDGTASMLDQFYNVIFSESKYTDGKDGNDKPKYMQTEQLGSSSQTNNDTLALFCDILKDITVEIIKSRHAIDHHPMIYIPRSFAHVKFEL
ncbi:hypothetical protein RFI_20166, partial [Reticulomyxa filosa]